MVRIDADLDGDVCLGWSQSVFLCVDCLAYLGSQAVVAVCEARQDGEKHD